MNDPVEVRLETKRLYLRPFGSADVEDLFEYANQIKVARAAGFSCCETLPQAMLFGAMLQRAGSLMLELKETQKVIGNIGLYQVAHKDKVCELGYDLNEDYWHKGYMSEALGAVVTYAKARGLKRLEARVARHNQASSKVLLKNGFLAGEKYHVDDWYVENENKDQQLFYLELA